MQDFEPIYSSLNQIETQQITNNDVNRLVDKMNDCFLNCAEKKFGKLENEYGKTSKNPAWYGPNCKNKRRKWHRAKHRYRLQKTQCNKFELKQANKSYKSTMKKHYN